MTGSGKVAVLAALCFPASSVISYWGEHVIIGQQLVPVLYSTIFLTFSTILMILVMKLRESFLRETFTVRPEFRSDGGMRFDPKSVNALSSWMGILGVLSTVLGAHNGFQQGFPWMDIVHDACTVSGALGISLYLNTQVGLSYAMEPVSGRVVCRLRNFLRWCSLFVLTAWLIVSVVVVNERNLGNRSLSDESLRTLGVVCLAAEATTLLLLAVFIATFAREFRLVSAQLFKIDFNDPPMYLVKVEQQPLHL